MRIINFLSIFAFAVIATSCSTAEAEVEKSNLEVTEVVSPFAKWSSFNPANQDLYFPIGVYTQEPELAGQYKELGINCYYYLWEGPYESQIVELRKHGMRLISEFNDYARENLINDTIVIAWTQLDEPDLASNHKGKLDKLGQVKTKELMKKVWSSMYDEMELDTRDYEGWGFGYGPKYCQDHYDDIVKYDTTRPVIMGLSMGVVANSLKARGDRSGHREDYLEYVKASDVLAFDIYPIAYSMPEDLYKVADGMDSLRRWDATNSKPRIVAIECTYGYPDNPVANASQIRSEIWLSIIRGAKGISYFTHNFTEAGSLHSDHGLLENPEMMEVVKKQNAEITPLTKVIFADEDSSVSVAGENIDFVAKKVDGYLYIFSGTNRSNEAKAVFTVKGLDNATVEVINEQRSIELVDGKFADNFNKGFDVNLYKIKL